MSSRAPVVYLLHGLLETSYGHFRPQIEAWNQEFRLVPVDLPGHGRCPVDASCPYVEMMRSYVTAVVDRMGPGRVVAASFLGGPVGVRCAAERPDLVTSLVLTGFVPDVPQDVFRGWVQSVITASLASGELVSAYERVHGSRWRSTLETFVAEVDDRYGAGMRVTASMLGRLRRPVLIANGSKKSSERGAAAAAGGLGPHVSGSVIDGAGHIPGRDRPEAFQTVVEQFWRELDVHLANA
jgi:pimeloyl-ACP methyl ester carboxylesterase